MPGREPVAREEEFKACGGKLLGRPDVIQGEDVVDYKSGAVVEYDEATQSDVVKAAYVRQLRLYGYLVQQRSGACPRRGILLPAVGEGVEVALTPKECEDEARQAVALLDEYNARVRSGAPPETFASAMPANCKWCSYKLVCASFWQSASADWSGRLDGAAVEGTVIEAPQAVQGGAALAFSLDVEAGSESSRRARVSPLNPNVHDSVTGLRVGDRVRVVGLRIRSDGVLVPSPRTVIRAVSEIPVVIAGDAAGV
jgi:CRISPR/Cas system-associated exonuclease Cas4 (RecB family)